jgi:hypothetical protein
MGRALCQWIGCQPTLRADSQGQTRMVWPYTLCFLQHSLERLCYDGVLHAYTGTAPDREETVWALSRSWLR